jgi:hypothetical protein
MSGAPPLVKVTTMRIGLLGKFCADDWAPAEAAALKAIVAMPIRAINF